MKKHLGKFTNYGHKLIAKFKKAKLWQKVALAALPLLLIIGFFVPPTKYAFLNLVSSAEVNILVVDSETEQPIQGATVSIADMTAVKTNDEGLAAFSSLNYGKAEVSIQKDNYSSITADIEVKSSNVTLGGYRLTAQGIPFKITASDWLNNQAVGEFTVKNADSTLR